MFGCHKQRAVLEGQRSHECERGTQECVRHNDFNISHECVRHKAPYYAPAPNTWPLRSLPDAATIAASANTVTAVSAMAVA
jgi:hypothetical protein